MRICELKTVMLSVPVADAGFCKGWFLVTLERVSAPQIFWDTPTSGANGVTRSVNKK